MTRFGLLTALSAASAFAWPFSIGVRGGVPLANNFNIARPFTSLLESASYSSKVNRYTVGPSFEARLPFRLGIEVDALYRHLHYSESVTEVSPSCCTTTENGKVTAARWEFPVLLKYRLPARSLHPYLGAGVAFNHVSAAEHSLRGFKDLFSKDFTYSTAVFQVTPENRSTAGFVAAGGLEFRFHGLRISPEVRYTRWGAENFEVPSSVLRSNLNQADVLLGFSF